MSGSALLDRFRPILSISVFYLFLSLLARLVFWKVFGPPAEVLWRELPTILITGLINDGVVLVFLTLPMTIYLALAPGRLMGRPWHRVWLGLLFFFVIFGLFYLTVTEFFFFKEFNARFNLVAVDYLIYPHEVLINIWESYPVVGVLLVDAALSFLILSQLWPRWRPMFQVPVSFRKRLLFLAGHLFLLIPALLFSTDSLDFSGNRVADELSHNGISSFFQAFHTNRLDFNAFYRTIDEHQAFQMVRSALQDDGKFTSSDPQDLNRNHTPLTSPPENWNVVVVVEESFSASFCGVFGDQRNLTPQFDALSRKGLLFTNAYASGTRTVRGLEAITTSLPPIPSEAIIKRPGNENIANWGKIMHRQGYHTSFLYGGYGTFDNMNYFFSHNGFAISDRRDIPAPRFSNIWGVSDGDLFHHALDYYDGLARTGTPFFSIIMSTSNHTPYTFPQGIPGIPAKGGGRKAGVRYADYALGQFLDQASRHPWFSNTLFVVVADHCARVYGREQIPVATYHIPLLFYAPGLVRPGRVDLPIGQIDIAPTVLGLLGFSYTAPFYGHDVLHWSQAADNPLFLNHNHDVAMLIKDRMAVLGLHRSARLYRYNRERNSLAPLPADQDLFDRTSAIFQTAYDLFKTHRYQ